ncbi:MAG: GMP synthase (glutamine-hydrolyzing) [Clostridia bacterium]|nr:GMP synthase (glutamine-hydrolyzing) [Clostridia bacterium]
MANDFILVLDLGGPEAIEMARKLRYQHYYTEIMSRRADIELFRRKAPMGILIVGGDDASDTRGFPRDVLDLGVPVLALGGAARMMIEACGSASLGTVLANQATQITFQPCLLFDQLTESDRYFTRVDSYDLPDGFRAIATNIDGIVPAFGDLDRDLYGLQFYAESNDPDGAVILSNFAEKICGCTPKWNIDDYIDEEVRFIRERVGAGRALMAVSGGIDSTACAMLMKRAIGDRLTCLFIDTGLLREDEPEQVPNELCELGLNVVCIDAVDRFLERLRGLSDPLDKRTAAHDEFQRILQEYGHANGEPDCFVQGTIYPDLLVRGAADEIYALRSEPGNLLEPVRMLFKEEIRSLGERLGIPQSITTRQHFPAPGLALRCMGEVSAEKLSMLRSADAILQEEIRETGQDKRITQYFAVLLEGTSLGYRGGRIGFEHACSIRAINAQSMFGYTVARLPYDLLERIASRIIAEVPGINRVTYDLSPDLCTAIEWA